MLADVANEARVAAKHEVAPCRTTRRDRVPHPKRAHVLDPNHQRAIGLQRRQCVRVERVVLAHAVGRGGEDLRIPRVGILRQLRCPTLCDLLGRHLLLGEVLSQGVKLLQLCDIRQLHCCDNWIYLNRLALSVDVRHSVVKPRVTRIEVVEAQVGAGQNERQACLRA